MFQRRPIHPAQQFVSRFVQKTTELKSILDHLLLSMMIYTGQPEERGHHAKRPDGRTETYFSQRFLHANRRGRGRQGLHRHFRPE